MAADDSGWSRVGEGCRSDTSRAIMVARNNCPEIVSSMLMLRAKDVVGTMPPVPEVVSVARLK